jgi:hypothetical protein
MATAKKKPTEKDLEAIENPQADYCDYCDISYAEFPTGETYQSVYESLWSGSDDPEDWQYKRRGTVLGRWHQIKQSMWRDHLEQCEEMDSIEVEGDDIEPWEEEY